MYIYRSMLVHLCVVSTCAISHLLWNVLIASGAMNEPVMADTLPLTTECSQWIVTIKSVMNLPTCIAQTDECAVCGTHQMPNVGQLMVYMSCIVILCPGLGGYKPLFVIPIHVHNPINTDEWVSSYSFGKNARILFSERTCIVPVLCCMVITCMYILVRSYTWSSIGQTWLPDTIKYIHSQSSRHETQIFPFVGCTRSVPCTLLCLLAIMRNL